MMQFGHCPRCGNEISAERIVGGTLVCNCGWTRSLRSDSVDRSNIDRTCASIIVIGALLIASFLHAVNWDRHFFAIIPLKAKHVIGMANTQDLDKIAEICAERKKHECVERAYADIEKQQPQNIENLARLGLLQYKRDRFNNAAATFAKYFQLKGSDLDAIYTYAQTLTRLKRFDEADTYYRSALQKKDDVLQVTVIRNYVQMLMSTSRLQDAKAVILKYRKGSASANLFMAKELEDIRARLGEVKTAKM
jgi:tetratricopeptide (TPR) repeat protein